MAQTIELTPSRQSYLAEILALEKEQGSARQSEIAERLRVNKPSVSAALRTLAAGGLIDYEPYGPVELTPKGREIAETVLARRQVICDYLVRFLDIHEECAHKAARLMQSSVPEVVIDGFAAQLEEPE